MERVAYEVAGADFLSGHLNGSQPCQMQYNHTFKNVLSVLLNKTHPSFLHLNTHTTLFLLMIISAVEIF